MLILCYGITKSGSTLAFELVKGMLASLDHIQHRLPDGVVNPGHRVNYIQPLGEKRFLALLDTVGDRWIAVKTHGVFDNSLFPLLEELQRNRRLQIMVSYRDPRDICLSLVDAGVRSRAAGRKEFSEVTDIAGAVPRISEQILKFRKWAAVKGALRLDYDLVAFSPDEAIARIEECLQIASDREEAKKHAFSGAFTQKNKGIACRALKELPPAQYEQLSNAFSSFLREAAQDGNKAWLSNARDEILWRLVRRQRSAARGRLKDLLVRGPAESKAPGND